MAKRPTSLPITGGSFEPSVPLEGKEAISFVVSRAARLHAGPSVSSPVTHLYPVGTELKLVGHEQGWFLVSDPATLRQGWIYERVLSPADPWSWPDAARGARLAKPHKSGARGSKAEACKQGQETRTPTKNHQITISAEQNYSYRSSTHPQRVRQLDREGISRLLRSDSHSASTQSR